jgi:hypothetical protein
VLNPGSLSTSIEPSICWRLRDEFTGSGTNQVLWAEGALKFEGWDLLETEDAGICDCDAVGAET